MVLNKYRLFDFEYQKSKGIKTRKTQLLSSVLFVFGIYHCSNKYTYMGPYTRFIIIPTNQLTFTILPTIQYSIIINSKINEDFLWHETERKI